MSFFFGQRGQKEASGGMLVNNAANTASFLFLLFRNALVYLAQSRRINSGGVEYEEERDEPAEEKITNRGPRV